MVIIIFGAISGIVFGFALEKSGVLDPETIIGQMQLKRFTMIRVFLTGIITGLIVYQVLSLVGLGSLNWKTMHLWQDILGGALLGAGIVLSGACPGTVFGQIGVGYKDALVTFLGGLCGAITFIYVKPTMISLISQWPNEKILISDLLGIDITITRFTMIMVFIILLWVIKRLPK